VSELPFPVIDVSDWPIIADETSGAETKYWLLKPGSDERWLFKTVTIKQGHVHGEDWAEKVVAHLAGMLTIPCAEIEMAEFRGDSGCISADLRPPGHELQPGQVLLEEREAPGYVHAKGRHHPGHTLENIQRVLDDARPPPGWDAPFDTTAFDVFAGYLMLDAWVANRDRHDNNWAVLRSIAGPGGQLMLCGSYDHANSLGFNVTDEKRSLLLAERGGMERWCGRGYADRFEQPGASGRLTLVSLCAEAMNQCSERARSYWLPHLNRPDLDEAVRDALAQVPRMSDAARSFAYKILEINRRRILDACS
jgi:hypothetical protein